MRAAHEVAVLTAEQKNSILLEIADKSIVRTPQIIEANQQDLIQ